MIKKGELFLAHFPNRIAFHSRQHDGDMTQEFPSKGILIPHEERPVAESIAAAVFCAFPTTDYADCKDHCKNVVLPFQTQCAEELSSQCGGPGHQ